jgi:tRNA U34 5-methylaminomethyl-2-thiouridine-forming methyltransferase MnmC
MTTKDDQISVMTEFGALVQTADGSWTIRHEVHGQDFHSSEGARFEAWELYVVASGLLTVLKSSEVRPVGVLDVGMGLGYNACATIAAWLTGDGSSDLSILSLEIDSRLVETLASGDTPWIRGWDDLWLAGPRCLKKISTTTWSASISHPRSAKTLSWTIVIGDAANLDLIQISKDVAPQDLQFVWQDPFTPELNPEMWSAAWFLRVKDIVCRDAVLMTYSVSRVVKDALSEAGWLPERFRTPGRKRHWLRASVKS